MGTDGCGSIEGTDMQNALYLAALLQKLRGDHTTWVGAAEAFHAATMGGAKALGRAKELGAVEAGRNPALVGYRPPRGLVTPPNNPVDQHLVSSGRNGGGPRTWCDGGGAHQRH